MWVKLIRVALILLTLAANAEGRKLHVVVITDDLDQEVGKSTAIDRGNIISLFTNNIAAEQLSLIEVPAVSLSVDTIVRTLQGLVINRDDSVFVYFAGHGALQPDGAPLLQVQGELFLRSLVSNLVEARSPYFYGLFTDCCSVSASDFEMHDMVPVEYSGTSEPQTPVLLTYLMLETPGRIDITTAKPFQKALGSDTLGGLGTKVFCDYIWRNRFARKDWDEVFRGVRNSMPIGFEWAQPEGAGRAPFFVHQGVIQKTQTLYSYRPMYGKNMNDARLGVSCDFQGVITVVLENSVASQVGLRVGDDIISINGNPVHTDRDVALNIVFSGRNLQLKTRSLATNESRDYNVQLPW